MLAKHYNDNFIFFCIAFFFLLIFLLRPHFIRIVLCFLKIFPFWVVLWWARTHTHVRIEKYSSFCFDSFIRNHWKCVLLCFFCHQVCIEQHNERCSNNFMISFFPFFIWINITNIGAACMCAAAYVSTENKIEWKMNAHGFCKRVAFLLALCFFYLCYFPWIIIIIIITT